MIQSTAQFRFYEELNDFLPEGCRKTDFQYAFFDKPSIKDAIEAIGVPHTEVDLILVNGRSVGFDYHLESEDRVSVYPTFESLDITPIIRLRALPLRSNKFIIDVQLGKLARLLRMLGFDTLYRNDYSDAEIIRISSREKRIIITRDKGILKNRSVTHGYWIRTASAESQVKEVLHRFDLIEQIRPFQRCIVCNGEISHIDKAEIIEELLPKTARYYDVFNRCVDCKKIYWKGSHYQKMEAWIERLVKESQSNATGRRS